MTYAWRLPWLILALVGLVGFWLTPVLTQLVTLTPHTPEAVQALMAEGRYAEAQETVVFALAQTPETPAAELERLAVEIARHRADPAYRLEQVLTGITTGTAAEIEGQVAGAVTDLTPLVGDLRDLVREGWRVVAGEDADGVVVTLAALGLVTSLSPPVKSGLGVLKGAQRLHLLPPWLVRELISLGRELPGNRSLAPLRRLLAPVMTLVEQVGLTDALRLLSRTTSRDSLTELVVLARVFGRDTGSLVRLGGETVIRAGQHLTRGGPERLKRASLYGPEGVKALVRWGPGRFDLLLHLTKVVYRQPWLGALCRGLLNLPRWGWLLLTSLGIMGWRPWSRR
jgi:hypothetical protein